MLSSFLETRRSIVVLAFGEENALLVWRSKEEYADCIVSKERIVKIDKLCFIMYP
jgi:hypothetical protein